MHHKANQTRQESVVRDIKGAEAADSLERQVPSPVLNERDAACYIGMSEMFLRVSRMGTTGGRTPGPSYLKLGRAVRYLQTDLDTWLLKHRVQCGQGR